MTEKKFVIAGMTDYQTQPSGVMEVWAQAVSDGYHTMEELYDHRRALNIALFHTLDALQVTAGFITVPSVYKSKNHHPNSDHMFEGYFIVFCVEPKSLAWTSYHYDLKYWDDFKLRIAEFSPPYPLNHVDSITFFSNMCWRR